ADGAGLSLRYVDPQPLADAGGAHGHGLLLARVLVGQLGHEGDLARVLAQLLGHLRPLAAGAATGGGGDLVDELESHGVSFLLLLCWYQALGLSGRWPSGRYSRSSPSTC